MSDVLVIGDDGRVEAVVRKAGPGLLSSGKRLVDLALFPNANVGDTLEAYDMAALSAEAEYSEWLIEAAAHRALSRMPSASIEVERIVTVEVPGPTEFVERIVHVEVPAAAVEPDPPADGIPEEFRSLRLADESPEKFTERMKRRWQNLKHLQIDGTKPTNSRALHDMMPEEIEELADLTARNKRANWLD